MIFKLTTKGCKLSEKSKQHLDHHLHKITQALPHTEEDLVVLRLNLKKNIDLYHPQKVRHHHRSYADKKPEIAYFEGSISLRLNKKRLYVHFKGQTIDEGLKLGFDRIFEELEKYKDLHFKSESEYPNHLSIRRQMV